MSEINVNWLDADTNEEIEGWYFPVLEVRPMVGDSVHYWEDAGAGDGINRHDYVVAKVEHDLRFMSRSSGYVHSLVVCIRKVEP